MNRNEQLIAEARKRMEHLFEYSFYNDMNEEGEQDNAQGGGDPNAMSGDPNAMGGAPMGGDPNAMGGDPNAMGMDPMGGDPNAMGGDPNAMGGDPNAMGGAPMGGDPNAMGGGMDMGQGANLAPNAGQPDPSMGGDPNAMGMDPMGGDPNAMGMGPMGGAQPGPNDDVVDITALTDAQEQMQQSQDTQSQQLEDIDSKFSNLMQVMDKFTQALDASDKKIADLKKELVKRNPTEEETMNVRLQAGGNPFDQKPEEFWDKFKDINNHYNITRNNEAPQYQIRKSDIDNGFNDHLIDDTFDGVPGSLKEYFTR